MTELVTAAEGRDDGAQLIVQEKVDATVEVELAVEVTVTVMAVSVALPADERGREQCRRR